MEVDPLEAYTGFPFVGTTRCWEVSGRIGALLRTPRKSEGEMILRDCVGR